MDSLGSAIEHAHAIDDPYVEGISAEDEVFDGIDLGFFELHGTELANCSLVGANLAKASLYDSTLVGCDLSNANLTEAFLSRTRLVGCKLAGATLTRAILRSTRLVDCNCRYLNAGEAKFENVRLERCDLREAFLNELRLRKGTRFEECSLVRADLFRTRLAGIDLSTCDIDGLGVSDTREELRGALFCTEQAPTLAALLGIRFVDL